GALVQALPADGASAPGATVYLVTDQGIRYALATRSGDAKTALGYGDVEPVQVPSSLLALIPTGPTLDRAAATRVFAVSPNPAPAPSSPRPSSPSPGSSRPPSATPQPSSSLR
ncbi:MAG TPA: type VII secretion protein EccB, partial [Kribbellaceae bacterium]|nr:type VII secretion protein EccB [Kribbellaceae bacterium]